MIDIGLACRMIAMALTVALSGPALAQWAWKDDNGRVVYSDRPPPSSVKSDHIVRQPSNTQAVMPAPSSGAGESAAKPAEGQTAAPAASKSLAEQEMEFQKRQQQRADAERKAQEEQSRAQAKTAECERAKGYLRVLEEGGRVARTDAAGNREFLDDAQRATEIDRTRKIMQSACGSGNS